jgi:hypothetical protein
VKKVRNGDENCVEKLSKLPNFYAREGKVRSVFFTNKPMILLVCKEWYGSALWYNPSKVRFQFWHKICIFQSYVIDDNNKSRLYEFFLFTFFWLVYFLFGKDPFSSRMWELILRIFFFSFSRIFNELQYNLLSVAWVH